MRAISQIAADLAEQHRELQRRIESIESEVEAARSARQISRETLTVRFPAIGDVEAIERHELALLESAQRRLAAREYDCCMTCGGQISWDRLDAYPYAVNCERCTVHFGPEYEQQIRLQHVKIREMADALQEARRALSANAGAAPDSVAVVASRVLLHFLARLLPDHFELEERGGYMADALAVAPQLADRAETIRRQHALLRRDISRLAEWARSAGDEASEWQTISEHIHRFSAALVQHERAEAGLVQDALTDDIGTSG